MSKTRTFQAALAALMALAGMVLLNPQMSSAYVWTSNPVKAGGVAEDQQLLSHEDEAR